MNKRDKELVKKICDQIPWLATICRSPHIGQRLAAAAECHLVFAVQDGTPRLAKRACSSPQHAQQTTSPRKRRELHHEHHHAAATQAADPLQQLQQAAIAGAVRKVEQLCQPGGGVSDVNAAFGAESRTALHAAAEAGRAQAVQALLDLGADPYCADVSGTSPLMMAAAGGHEAAVKVLLEAGADPFHVDCAGENPLMFAARAGSAPCIQLLLAEGVDADYANTDLGDGGHALLLAAEAGDVAAVRLLLQAGARVNRSDKAGRAALWVAARKGHALVVQLLLSQPGVKHIRSFGGGGSSPLQEAQAARHATCVALLSAHHQAQHQHQLQHSPEQVHQPAAQSRARSQTAKQQQQHKRPHQHAKPRHSPKQSSKQAARKGGSSVQAGKLGAAGVSRSLQLQARTAVVH